jgi:hypothetical protein
MIKQLHATALLKGAIQDGPGVGQSAAANGIMLVLHCHRMLAHCSSTLTLSSVASHIMAHTIIIPWTICSLDLSSKGTLKIQLASLD